MYRSIVPGRALRRQSPARRPRVPVKCPPNFAPTDGSPRVLTHPDLSHSTARGAVRFDPVGSPATLAGSTTHFHVYYADLLGKTGSEIADAALQKCEGDYRMLADFFGQKESLMFNVIIAPLSAQMDGRGGAYHHSCLARDLYCDAQTTPIINADVTNALIVAEAAEVFAAVQGEGWRCGRSNGEGLSRALASELYPKVLETLGYSTARFWLNSRRPNLVRRALPTDTSVIANGCSVLFLNYLHAQLGFTWNQICQAGAPTLAGTYRKLTNNMGAFADFAKLLEKKFPSGKAVDLETDNPFPIEDKTRTTERTQKAATKRKNKDR